MATRFLRNRKNGKWLHRIDHADGPFAQSQDEAKKSASAAFGVAQADIQVVESEAFTEADRTALREATGWGTGTVPAPDSAATTLTRVADAPRPRQDVLEAKLVASSLTLAEVNELLRIYVGRRSI